MKFFLSSLLLLINLAATSQTNLPDSFRIGDFVELFNRDSIRVYFNCTGKVVDKKCASYYRVGKMDAEIINVAGEFYDYALNGKLYLKATMLNNNIEGVAHYYHENGKVKEKGTYQNNIRQGKWLFYYPNGNIQKVYEYVNGEPTVLEAYAPNGEATVVNGNGSFKTEFSNFKQCEKFVAFGHLFNGRKNGKWTFSNIRAALPIATETYEEGNFIKGNSNNYEYTEYPKISFSNFYPNEYLNLLDNSPGCPGDSLIFFWEYNTQNIHLTFYPELQEKLTKYSIPVKNQWLVVGIKLSEKNKLLEINVASSINDTDVENYVYNSISKMTKWKTAIVNSKKIESNIFFTVLVDNNQFIIPTDYIFHNRGN